MDLLCSKPTNPCFSAITREDILLTYLKDRGKENCRLVHKTDLKMEQKCLADFKTSRILKE